LILGAVDIVHCEQEEPTEEEPTLSGVISQAHWMAMDTP
jgi:hypothetical protein